MMQYSFKTARTSGEADSPGEVCWAEPRRLDKPVVSEKAQASAKIDARDFIRLLQSRNSYAPRVCRRDARTAQV
jgi:hypothetical protein